MLPMLLAQAARDYGLNVAAGRAGLTETAIARTTIPEFIGQLIGIGLGFIGIIFFILMLYGGFLWLTARGDEKRVEQSKSIITDAIIGLVIVVASYLVSAFIFQRLTQPGATSQPSGGAAPAPSCAAQCAGDVDPPSCISSCEALQSYEEMQSVSPP
jgi:TRAP-type C4-dicarboxylate transport system permease small subunit